MMKWAGLAFLGLIAVSAWEVPESWHAQWTGTEPAVVVLDTRTFEDLAEANLLTADLEHNCSWQATELVTESPERLSADAQRAIASLLVRLNEGRDPVEVVVLQDASAPASDKVAIAILDPQTGRILHHGAYSLEGRSDDAALDTVGQDI